MDDGIMAEIRMFAGNFAPKYWAICNGALLSIAQNQALFSLLGTTYGGDGVTTFALPDLRGRVPVHTGSSGNGPGPVGQPALGQKYGEEQHTLTTAEMPAHTHTLAITKMASNVSANRDNPQNNICANDDGQNCYNQLAPNVTMSPQSIQVTIGPSGNNLPFNTRQSGLALNYIICTQGMYPSRP
ncbi:MAG: tail fiber protein [Bacteroidia bacterium]|nr:tail fiber protein [Bacteroidia bacterium]